MNWQKHWQKAQENQIVASIVVGPGIKSGQKAIEIAKTDPQLFAAIGIHPERANKNDDIEALIEEFKKLSENNELVAIGETGLDYYYLPEGASAEKIALIKEKQKKLFIAQIEIAKNLNLPLILHVRDKNKDAYFDTLELLKKHWNFKNSIVFHCVSGPIEYIEEALSLEKSYFGFDGNSSFKNAEEIREIFRLVQKTNPKKILLETDAPWLAPVPHRGKICEPWMIKDLALYMERELEANLEEIYQNSIRAFKLNI
jgi:TatD DNase family protein